MELNLDATDKKLLGALIRNSRLPMAKLAKSAGVSREVATYRLQRLKDRGILLDYVTEIDMEKMGYVGAAVFVATKTQRESEIREYLKNSPHICWVGEHVGIWDFGMSIFGKTIEEVDDKFRKMQEKFKDIIIDHRFTQHKRNHYYYEKLFGVPLSRPPPRGKPHSLDQTDKTLLRELALNSRSDYTHLSKKVPLTAQAIKKRIKTLESGGYIKKYTVFLDYSKLNIYQYSIFIVNKNVDDRRKLLAFLEEHQDVCFICEYIGDPFLEFGVFVDDPYKLRRIIRVIEESFPDNRIVEHSLQKEFVSFGPARCVFE